MAETLYLKIIFSTNHKHMLDERPVCAFVYNFDKDKIKTFNFNHPDLEPNHTFFEFKQFISDDNLYVIDKKKYKYFLGNCKLYDLNVIKFIQDATLIDIETNKILYNIPRDLNEYNVVVPFVIHQRNFKEELEYIKRIDIKKYDKYSFSFFNDFMADTLYEVEKNGLKIDVDMFNEKFGKNKKTDFVYTEYNILNNTGRPTNRFDNINYSALNKNDGSRKSFISRYDNGYYMTVDYTAFHPSIVCDLINYQITGYESIYEYLAEKYFGTKTITDELIKKSKRLTMINLYGEIKDNFLNIEFFKKTELLKMKYWEEFLKNGYIRTHIYKRKITKDNIADANKNKLFAYLIQALETEYAINALHECVKYVYDKNICPVLYVYDSVVFDVDSKCKKSDIIDLLHIFKSRKFKIKTYIGKNYDEMCQLSV